MQETIWFVVLVLGLAFSGLPYGPQLAAFLIGGIIYKMVRS